MAAAIAVVTKCSDSLASTTQLAVVRALLTVATSEHFVAHGEALVQCMRIVFNLAIATEDRTIGLTAQNALLQVCSHLIPSLCGATVSVVGHACRKTERVWTRGGPCLGLGHGCTLA